MPRKALSTPEKVAFFRYILQKGQLIDLALFVAIYIVVYILLALYIPFPFTTYDSGSYILSAKKLVIGGYRPIGYSWFIHAVHMVSKSAAFLFSAQYFLHVLVTLGFMFTVKYFWNPVNRWVYYAFMLPIVLSPTTLFMTNYVMSDGLFNTLTLLWIVSGIWIACSRRLAVRVAVILLHLLALYLAFNTRYLALYYPIVSTVWFVVAYKNKLAGAFIALLPILMAIGVYTGTKREMKRVYKVDTFSGFGGWATANNAVSLLPYVELDVKDIEDKELAFIHEIVTQFPDSVFALDKIIATRFMWQKNFPGKTVLAHVRQKTGRGYLPAWIYTGTLMNDYGNMLIKKFPLQYMQRYIIPNTLQVLKTYPIEQPALYKPTTLEKEWFDLKVEEFKYESRFFESLTPSRSVANYIRWALCFLALAVFIAKWKRLGFNREQLLSVAMIIFFGLGFMGASVMAHPINNFRYLVPLYALQVMLIYVIANQVVLRLKALKSQDKTIRASPSNR